MSSHIAKSDWDHVTDLAYEVANSSSIDDQVLCASRREALLAFLRDLEKKYGEHPAIMATIGDFLEDEKARREYYRRALRLARLYGDQKEEAEILDSIAKLNEESQKSG